jgi:hypothetical protein
MPRSYSDRRLSALERRRAIPTPHVLEVSPGTTIEEAVERFVAKWGAIPPGHAFIVVPPRIATHERPAKEFEWQEQQRRLLAEAKCYPKDTMQ